MSNQKIFVSRHDLTRCAGCGRHHEIDRTLSNAELRSLSCTFCGDFLIQSSSTQLKRASSLGVRSSRLAMGLLGASLSLTACDDEEVIEGKGGQVAGTEIIMAGEPIGMPEYGVFPAGDDLIAGEAVAGAQVPPYGSFGAEEAGSMAGEVPAGEGFAPMYGSFPAGEDTSGGDSAGVDMMPAGDDGASPEYGAFPAGEG